MYALIRTVHLFSGLILAAAMLMYTITGWVMAHHDWFGESEPVITVHELSSQVATSMPQGLSADDARRWQQQIGDELGMRGRTAKRHATDDGWRFEYARPGTLEKLALTPGISEVTLTVEEPGTVAMLNRLHHLHGYGGAPRYFLWGLLVDVTSVALILFPLTGIYLWFVLKKDRRLGWVILGGSSAYVIGSILFLVLGR